MNGPLIVQLGNPSFDFVAAAVLSATCAVLSFFVGVFRWRRLARPREERV
ncbi:MAG: hypothetical protein AAFR35_09220 [Pseudomonadota bacterium]